MGSYIINIVCHLPVVYRTILNSKKNAKSCSYYTINKLYEIILLIILYDYIFKLYKYIFDSPLSIKN